MWCQMANAGRAWIVIRVRHLDCNFSFPGRYFMFLTPWDFRRSSLQIFSFSDFDMRLILLRFQFFYFLDSIPLVLSCLSRSIQPFVPPRIALDTLCSY